MVPAFADETKYPSLYVQLMLDAAWRRISEEYLDTLADDAHVFLTAHLITATSRDRGGGVQSVSAGPISVSYFAGYGERGLNSTSYGREYLEIVKARGPGAMVVT